MFRLILVSALVAIAFSSAIPAKLEYPEDPAAAEDQVRDILAHKQHALNRVALYRGSGVGTAPYHGVPGTSLENRGYGYNNAYGFQHAGFYGNGFYGNAAYPGVGFVHGRNQGYVNHNFAAGYVN